MKRAIFLLVLAGVFFAYPFEGYTSDMLDSMYVRIKPTFQSAGYNEFFIHSLDSNRVISEEDSLSYSDVERRTRLSVRVVRSVVFMAEIPYYSRTFELMDQEYKTSGAGDIDLMLKYRPVTSESPVILVAGVTVPSGALDGDVALGNDQINGMIGILNTLEKNGFELVTNLFICLNGIGQTRPAIGNYARYIGTAEAPVLLNGQRIASISGEIDAYGGEKLKEEYLVYGKVGVEYRALPILRIQGGIKFPIVSSGVYPERKFTPLISATFEI